LNAWKHRFPRSSLLLGLLPIAVIALIPFLRVGLWGIVDQSDTSFPLYPVDFVSRMFSAWDSFGGQFGIFSFAQVSQGPLFGLPAFLSAIGPPINFVNRITLGALLALSGFSVYLLLVVVGKVSRIAGIVSAAYYIYGPYSVGEIWLGHWLALYTYLAAPLFLIVTVKGIESSRRWQGWAIAGAVLSYPILIRIRFLPIIAITLLLFLVSYRVTIGRSVSSRLARFSVVALLAGVAINLFWLLPLAADPSGVLSELGYQQGQIPTGSPPSFSDFLNIPRLIWYGIPLSNNSAGAFFISDTSALVGYILLAIAILPILSRKGDHLVLFAAITSLVVGFHMAAFTFSPLYRALYFSISNRAPWPLGPLLFPRDLAYVGWAVSLSYSCLLGKASDILGNTFYHLWLKARQNSSPSLTCSVIRLKHLKPINFQSVSRLVVPIILVLLILTQSLPLLAGGRNDPLTPVNVPSYYNDARLWLQSLPGSHRIFVTPPSTDLSYERYNWVAGSKVVTDILPQSFPFPSVTFRPGTSRAGEDILGLTQESFQNGTSPALLELIGTDLVLVKMDVQNASPTQLSDAARLGLIPLKSFGDLHFFEVPRHSEQLFVPTTPLVIWADDIGMIPALLNFKEIDASSTALFLANQLPFNQALSVAQASRQIVVLGEPSNSDSIALLGKESAAQVNYVVGQSLTIPFSTVEGQTPAKNYTAITRLSNGTEIVRTFSPSVEGDYNVFSYDKPTNESVMLQGVSVNSDGTDPNLNANLPGPQFNWTVDLSQAGFHALYFGVNSTSWNFPQLLTNGGGLSLLLFGDGSGRELRFSFMNPQGKYFQWPLGTMFLNWTGWRQITLPLNQFEPVSSPNWGNVVALWLWEDVPRGSSGISLTSMREIAPYLGPRNTLLVPVNHIIGGLISAAKTTLLGFTQISATEYQLTVTSDAPYFLVLNSAYDAGWQAYVNGQKALHVVTNFFANAFSVTQTGLTVLKISFSPQFDYQIGAAFSFGAITIFAMTYFPRIAIMRRRLRCQSGSVVS
jgi:hypothetical protein